MKKLAIALVTVLALLTPLSIPAPANAAEAYVTKTEFRKVAKGMSLRTVHRIFDTSGKQMFIGYGYQSREYKTSSEYGFVMIDFKRRQGVWRLDSKSAYWG